MTQHFSNSLKNPLIMNFRIQFKCGRKSENLFNVFKLEFILFYLIVYLVGLSI